MTTPESWLAIVNPASGRARSRAIWPVTERALREAGVRCDVVTTTHPHAGETIARQAVLGGRRRILIVGGDGSVHDVLNGVMDSATPGDEPVTLAVAPDGTGNDWARSLGIDRDPSAIAGSIVSGRTMALDVGMIDFPRAVPAARRWFVNVAGAGYDAHVISRLPARVPSRLAYLRGAIGGLATYRSPDFRITAGEHRFEGRLLLAFVANGRYCGHGMIVAPVARLDDGLFDLVMIREVGLVTVLAKIAKLYRGTILADPVTQHLKCAAVSIDTEPPVAVEADGQVVGRTPAVFSMRPGAIRVVAPGAPPGRGMA
jgi:diacylglycerol kinase (ATP)